ncbi:MAG: sensor histidine kinase [Spirochaetes bacterium]|nr:sensor histidine kinase [Spirochaetota bacterium]
MDQIKIKRDIYITWYTTLITISLFLGFFFILLYFKRKNDVFYIYFAGLTASIGIWILGLKGIILCLIDSQLAYYLTTYIGAFLTPIMVLNFLQSFLKQKKHILTRLFEIIYSFFALFLISEIILSGQIYIFKKLIFKPFMFTTAVLILFGIYLSIIGIKNKIHYAKTIASGTIILGISTLITIFKYTLSLNLPDITIESFFIMIILFCTILATRYSEVFNDLETAHSDLLVLDKMKDDFLATTTHELRTPLHGIMGIAESMETGALGDLNARQKENLELIRSSAMRLNGLVNSILDFSKLRAGKADLFLEEVSIGDLVSSALSLLKPSAQEKGLELRSEIGDLPMIKADRNRLYQIIFNLAGNAIKFTDTGSVVVKATTGDGHARVCVTDTGPGIAPEDLGRIWSPFTQAESAETRHTVGTGLGLAITKYLVELHGGRIWAESEPGKGSVFCFELPLEPPAAGIERTTGSGEAPA